ncbi:MAG: hypothetical protein K9L26_02725 [Candidatus Izimaplasma sp.]|nr:hypothetical protein [Candidatus Izimaplasma bacterium]
MKKLVLVLVLLTVMSVIKVNADTLSYDPITITMDNCVVDETQTVFFDVLIDDTAYSLQSSINQTYLTEYPNAATFDYLGRNGYQSYLAFYPDADFFAVNCYTNIESITDTLITEYKLIAFDELGNEIVTSDVYQIDDVGYNPTTNRTDYYQYDEATQSFSIVSYEAPTDPFTEGVNFFGTVFIGFILFMMMAFVGIIPFMVFSKKANKNYYVISMLLSNALFMLTLVLLITLLSDLLFSMALVILAHLLIDIAMFKYIDKRFNPTYRVLDVIYIHIVYLSLLFILWTLLQQMIVT